MRNQTQSKYTYSQNTNIKIHTYLTKYISFRFSQNIYTANQYANTVLLVFRMNVIGYKTDKNVVSQ